jgi:ankyrin repeat protein
MDRSPLLCVTFVPRFFAFAVQRDADAITLAGVCGAFHEAARLFGAASGAWRALRDENTRASRSDDTLLERRRRAIMNASRVGIAWVAAQLAHATPELQLATAFAAAQFDRAMTLDWLLGSKAVSDVDACDNRGTTLLMAAAREGSDSAVELLLSLGANIAARDVVGHTPLLHACVGGGARTIELLIAGGASINEASEIGWTPVIVAAAAGNMRALRDLKARGADPRAVAQGFVTAVAVARRNGRDDAMSMLTDWLEQLRR